MSVSKTAAVQPVSPHPVEDDPLHGVESQFPFIGVGSRFRQPVRPLAARPRWERRPLAPGRDPRRAAADPATAVETLLSLFAEFPCEVLANPAWQLAAVADSSLVEALSDDDLARACPHAVREEAFVGLVRDRLGRSNNSVWKAVDVMVELADTPRDILDAIYARWTASGVRDTNKAFRTLTFRLASPESTVALWRSGLQIERERLAADSSHKVTNQRRLQRSRTTVEIDLRVLAGCVTSHHLIDRVLAASHPGSRLAWVEKLAHDPHWMVRGAACEALATRKAAG
jgi:hypothetical protein